MLNNLYRHLEERLLVLEQCHNSSDDTATLQERCLALKQQVEEMEVSCNSIVFTLINYSVTDCRSFWLIMV